MKIAIITSGFLPIIDGVTVSGMQRLKRLSQWGHEVILFCPDYSSVTSSRLSLLRNRKRASIIANGSCSPNS